MTTTGTTNFTLDFTDIAEEAWERAGREMRSGYDLRTARRSMNLMTIEWQNRGINMWTIEQGTIPLTPGLNTYALPLDTIDLLEHVIRTGAVAHVHAGGRKAQVIASTCDAAVERHCAAGGGQQRIGSQGHRTAVGLVARACTHVAGGHVVGQAGGAAD